MIDGLGKVGGVDLAIARQVGRLGRSLPSLKWHRRTSPTLHARGRTSDGDLNASGADVEGRASLVGLAFQQRLTAGLVNQIPDRVAVGVGSVFNRVVVPGGHRRIDHRDRDCSIAGTGGVLGANHVPRLAQIASARRRLLRHADQGLRRTLQRGGSGSFSGGAIVSRHRKVVPLAVDQRTAADVVLSNLDIALDPKVGTDLQGHIEHHAGLFVESNTENRGNAVFDVEGSHLDALRKRSFGRGQLIEVVAFKFEASRTLAFGGLNRLVVPAPIQDDRLVEFDYADVGLDRRLGHLEEAVVGVLHKLVGKF